MTREIEVQDAQDSRDFSLAGRGCGSYKKSSGVQLCTGGCVGEGHMGYGGVRRGALVMKGRAARTRRIRMLLPRQPTTPVSS